MQKNYRDKLSRVLRFGIAASLAFMPFTILNVNAAVTNVSFTGTDFTSSSLAVGTTTTAEAVLNFTTAAALDGASGDTIVITLAGFHPQTDALANTDLTVDGPGGTNCGASISPVSAAPGATEIQATFSNNVADTDAPVITLTLGASVACNTGDFDLDFATGSIESSDTAGNYGITIDTSAESGGGFVYVGDENDVQVQAQVTSTLAFTIRNNADTGDQANVGGAAVGPNLCDLGTLTTAAVGDCDYRLKVSTNATSGYDVFLQVNQDLQNGSGEVLDAVADGTVTLNNEEYGIAVAPGSVTGGGAITVTAPWTNSTDVELSTSNASTATEILSSSSLNAPGASGDTTNTSLVTHKAGIDAATPAGTYTQLVTYTVTPNF